MELYISEDKDLFHSLFDNKAAIESDAALTFDWRELPERKASRIVIEKGVTFGDKSHTRSTKHQLLYEYPFHQQRRRNQYLPKQRGCGKGCQRIKISSILSVPDA